MRFVITLIVLTLSLIFTSTISSAEVAVYAKRTSGGENLYETEYARSGEWHIACSTQVKGPSVGRRWCSIEPLRSDQFANDNFLDTARSGVNVKIWRDADYDVPAGSDDVFASVDFIPTRTVSPSSQYAVACGEYSVLAEAPAERHSTDVFSGRQAEALLSAMTEAEACQIEYFAEDSMRNNETMDVSGLDAVLEYAERFTAMGVGHTY